MCFHNHEELTVTHTQTLNRETPGAEVKGKGVFPFFEDVCECQGWTVRHSTAWMFVGQKEGTLSGRVYDLAPSGPLTLGPHRGALL